LKSARVKISWTVSDSLDVKASFEHTCALFAYCLTTVAFLRFFTKPLSTWEQRAQTELK